jgi:hypothetical protein
MRRPAPARWPTHRKRKQRIACVHRQLPGRIRLPQPGDDIAIDLDHMQMVEPPQERAGQGAQPGTDLDQPVVPLHRQQMDDVRDELLIDQKILAKALARDMRPHPISPCCWLADHLDCLLDGHQQAAGIRLPAAREFERGPMINRSADDRQSQSDVDTMTKTRVLERRQPLVVVHRQNAVAACQHRRRKHRVGR